MCAIFLKHGDELVEMVEQPYEAEDVLQQLLAVPDDVLGWVTQVAG
jgi:DNA-binding FrmR family transcriptional regulator